MPPWLDSRAAADYVGLASKTLLNRRSRGLRPRANRIAGRLRYDQAELDDWIQSNGAEPVKRGRPAKKT